MKIGHLTLAIAIAGLAAGLFMKKREAGGWPQPDQPADADPAGWDAQDRHDARMEMTPAGDMPADVTSATVAPTAAADSPNPAERLQDEEPTRLAEAIEGSPDDLFDSNSQDGPYPRTPGLPDLTRGA